MNELLEARDVAETELDLGELGSSVAFLLRVAQLRAFGEFYADLGELGLQPAEFAVLWFLGKHGEVQQGLLAQALRIKAAHMTKTVRRLETQALVLRHIPANDRRSVLLSLSERGNEFVRKYEGRFFGFDARLKHNLGPIESAELIRLLRKLAAI